MFKTITVKELIDALNDFDHDAKVLFASDYGDRVGTQQAHRIKGHLEEVGLKETAYSDSGWKVVESGDGDIDDEAGDVIYVRIS